MFSLKSVARERNEDIASINHLEAWPPFMVPPPLPPNTADPLRVLQSRVFHAIAFSYLYKAVYDTEFSDIMLPYLIYLMDMCVEFHVRQKDAEGKALLSLH